MELSVQQAIHWLRVLEQEQKDKRDPACPEVYDEPAEALRMAIRAMEGRTEPDEALDIAIRALERMK